MRTWECEEVGGEEVGGEEVRGEEVGGKEVRIQSMMHPPWMFPFSETCRWMNFPKRLELLL